MNNTTSILVSLVLVIVVIVAVYGLYSGGLESIENALTGDEESMLNDAQNPAGSSYQGSEQTDTAAKLNLNRFGGIQNG